MHLDRGAPDEAIAAYQKALELDPNLANANFNLGNALRDAGRTDEAITAYQRFLEKHPDDAEAHNNLGVVLAKRADLTAASRAYQRALELNPNLAIAISNLADLLCHQGETEMAIPLFRRCVQWQPQCAWLHINLIYTLHFQPGLSAQTLLEEQRAWNRKFVPVANRAIKPHQSDRNPARRLRIGYVSPDLRHHVVGRNIMPLFKQRNSEEFEVICYSGVPHADDLTEEFRSCVDLWRCTIGLTAGQLAEMIRSDRVDILVDLSQHLAGNRLSTFALKPSPIQLSFAGYPESTGVETIEYRIGDPYLEGQPKPENWQIGWKSSSEETLEHVYLHRELLVL